MAMVLASIRVEVEELGRDSDESDDCVEDGNEASEFEMGELEQVVITASQSLACSCVASGSFTDKSGSDATNCRTATISVVSDTNPPFGVSRLQALSGSWTCFAIKGFGW